MLAFQQRIDGAVRFWAVEEEAKVRGAGHEELVASWLQAMCSDIQANRVLVAWGDVSDGVSKDSKGAPIMRWLADGVAEGLRERLVCTQRSSVRTRLASDQVEAVLCALVRLVGGLLGADIRGVVEIGQDGTRNLVISGQQWATRHFLGRLAEFHAGLYLDGEQ